MFRTYLKFATRTFWKDKFYTLLNIIGLAIGIAVSIIILLYLQNDLTYDQHHVNHNQIYRLVTNVKGPGVEFHTASAAREMAPMLAEDYPEILSFVRIQGIGRTLVNVPEQGEESLYNEEDWARADSTLFHVFTHPFLEGNPRTALREKNSIVLTETLARKYFGDEEAVGKSLLLFDAKENFTVTGVIEDLPDNSHLKFEALLSDIQPREFATRDGEFVSEAIWNPDVYTYLMFPEGYHTADFFEKLPPFHEKYIKPFGDQVSSELWFYLEPLADVHFHSVQDGDQPQGNYAYVYAFGGIGLFILLLACINYMNMATARSGNRVKEIGMRKVLGSSRKALIFSFLGESILLSVIALLIALAMVAIVLYATPFNELIEKDLSLNLLENPLLLSGAIGISLLMGIVSGLYPAFYLPSLSALQSLKGAFKSSASGIALRKSLVVLQFTISIAVVICTLLMQDQIRYVRNQELGFNREHLMLVPIQDTLVQNQIPYIKNEMEQYEGVVSTTVSYSIPGLSVGNQVFQVEIDSNLTTQAFRTFFVGEDYLKTMDIPLLAGRDFHEGFAGDRDGKSFIINEAAARALGWYQPEQQGAKLEDALKGRLMFFHGEELGNVVGVVRDFNVSSLHNAIEPTIIIPAGREGGVFYMRLKGENLPETLEYIQEKWAAYDPNHPFEFSFLDERFDELYRADERQSELISILSGICLLISLLGILGLSAFTAEQRTKEIGVRKVMGASVPHIVYLLFKDVMILVVVASLLAAPIAYYLIERWLQDFAYRTDLNILLFVLAGLAALLVAFITMSFHSLKTARLNPVVSLRYE
ncbi:FtsX-like permease family protein [Catalinimonas niigatensis]|uniref:FtsX-like permease family protein n=1 Tax=Catalinimonas niigatensis TaxID=1397264 RepID=UPI0026665FF1|nr:FtsX-like permease family protein [Catalinimonas niigatensis]WPP50306.1 FtsX-like permease family protein [Catalinimonas niigatensis]